MTESLIITINGKKQTDLAQDLQEVLVDTNIHLPNMFTIVLADEADPQTGRLRYTDGDNLFKIGAEVKIEMETDEVEGSSSSVKGTLIVGEITALEPAFTSSGKELLQIRGYDHGHRLGRGKKTRTYGDANPQGQGITEDKIIDTIIKETPGITKLQVDKSGLNRLKYSYVMQCNQTDLAFLQERARAIGYQVYVEDKTLYFQKADAHRGEARAKPVDYTWPLNLQSFHPRLVANQVVDQAVVKGWDPKTQKQIEGTSKSDKSKTSPEKIGLKQAGGPTAKKAYSGTVETALVGQPISTIDQAKALAAARYAERESTFIQAEGVCRNADPRLVAGRVVNIKGVGKRFSGEYYITEARHVYARGQYRATFSATGRTPNTVNHLLARKSGEEKPRIHGVVTAKVTSLEDPENLGRVQVTYPWLPKYKGAALASNWARLATPMGGKERGLFFIPEVDDEVLVCFEQGDMDFPYIVGGLWNHKQKPPQGTAAILANDKKKVNQRIIRSRSGHLIILDDTDGKEQIIIQDKSKKNSIVIDSKANSLTIKAGGDLVLEAGGKVQIKSKSDMTLDSQAKVAIKSKSDLALNAVGNGKFNAAQLALEGKAKSELKGAQVKVTGQAQTEVAANGQVAVKSSGITQIQGSLVKIN